jgi:NNP family nitrate/nitrite transporter-like MFS transporter
MKPPVEDPLETVTPDSPPPEGQPPKPNDRIIEWDVEDNSFWNGGGSHTAFRNLAISVPCLLFGFAVWLYWSIIIVQMENLSFAFSTTQLYTLPAIAGLAGATLRIPNSFMIAISGGRNVIAVTTALLLLPAAGVGSALQNPQSSYTTFVLLAALSGIGGGAFASSMSNISFFFPKRMQGLSLGLNAGLGNVGVSIMQELLPWAMTFAAFGAFSGQPSSLPQELGGGSIWIQNSGLVWVPLLAVFAVLAFLLMDNLPMHHVGSAPVAIGKMLWLEIMGFVGAIVGILLLLGPSFGVPDLVKVFLVLAITISITLLVMRFATPRAVRDNLSHQFVIFEKKTQLGYDVALHDDVRIVHRVLCRVSKTDSRRVRDVARRGAQPQLSKPTRLCLARPSGGITHSTCRGLAG